MKNLKQTDLLEVLQVAETNISNVKCIIKKLFDSLKINEINKTTLDNTDKIITVIKENMSSKKWLEIMGYVLKTSTLLKCKKKTKEAYKKELDELKKSRLLDYNKERVYKPDNYEECKDKLKAYFESSDKVKRRISILYYYLGGLRKGELLQCKVCNEEDINKLDTKYNYVNLFDSNLYIFNHKTQKSKGTRIIKLCNEIIDEVKEDEGFYLIHKSNKNKALSPNTFQTHFKKITGINPLDYRHAHAIYNTKQSAEKQHEEAEKLGHSLTTSHFIYSNDLVNNTVSKDKVRDAYRHYKQLKQQLKKQNEEKNKFLVSF